MDAQIIYVGALAEPLNPTFFNIFWKVYFKIYANIYLGMDILNVRGGAWYKYGSARFKYQQLVF